MNKYPKVSIVVPTYNRANSLKECVDSIIKQNYPNLEIIVSDDNSTDNTENLMREYTKRYDFIKYVKNNRYPKGPNRNKNNGLDYCNGDIIGIFDDDLMIDGVLNKMVSKIKEGYDVVMGNCKILSNRGDNGNFSGKGLNKNGEVDWRDYLCGNISGEYWSIFKREILGNKRFDTDLYGGEGTLWRGMLKNRKIYYFYEAVRIYRIHESSVSYLSLEKDSKVIKNYERDIQYYGDEMKKYYPCYLASIYKGAEYFAKLSGDYKTGFKYVINSIRLCSLLKSSYIMFIVMFLPKKVIPFLTKIRVYLKYGFTW